MKDSADRASMAGREWDFFAVDEDGLLAVLSTAGFGFIPQSVLDQAVRVEATMENVLAMPITGKAVDRRAPDDRSGDYSDWFELSARGFFTYDWQVHDGPYTTVSAPAVPLRKAQAGSLVSEIATLVTLQVSFESCLELWIADGDPAQSQRSGA